MMPIATPPCTGARGQTLMLLGEVTPDVAGVAFRRPAVGGGSIPRCWPLGTQPWCHSKLPSLKVSSCPRLLLRTNGYLACPLSDIKAGRCSLPVPPQFPSLSVQHTITTTITQSCQRILGPLLQTSSTHSNFDQFPAFWHQVRPVTITRLVSTLVLSNI